MVLVVMIVGVGSGGGVDVVGVVFRKTLWVFKYVFFYFFGNKYVKEYYPIHMARHTHTHNK